MKSYCLYLCSLLLIMTGCNPQNRNSGKLAVFSVNAGNIYLLRYRLLVIDGKIDKLQAEQAWKDFESPPLVRLEK